MNRQRPVLTVTLNPALDIAAGVETVEAGPKLRLSAPRVDPGGGGINVARVVARLGGAVVAFAALGGATGQRLAARIRAEGLELAAFDLPEETRESLTVQETGTGREFRFVLPGPDWTPGQEAAALEAIAAVTAPDAIVVLSGSQPPGVSDAFPAALASRLAEARAELIVDTSGSALARLVSAPDPANRPAVLRLDQAEAARLAGRPPSDPAAAAELATALRDRGVARIVVIACGAEGSVLAGPEGVRMHARPPAVQVVSKVGAGDSFVGAFALARARGKDAATALAVGVAAAAAAVTTPGTELCEAGDIPDILARVTTAPI